MSFHCTGFYRIFINKFIYLICCYTYSFYFIRIIIIEKIIILKNASLPVVNRCNKSEIIVYLIFVCYFFEFDIQLINQQVVYRKIDEHW